MKRMDSIKEKTKINVISLMLFPIIVLTFLLIIFSFPAGVYSVFLKEISNSTSYKTMLYGIYLFLGPTLIVLPLNVTLGNVFITLLIVYLSLTIMSCIRRIDIIKAIKSSFRSSYSELLNNDLVLVMLFSGLIILVSSIIDVIQSAFGIKTGSLVSQDPLQTFVGLTIAPLREELGFRMLLIGLVAFVLTLPDLKKGVKSLWKPSICSDQSLRKTIIIFMIFVSSLFFGLAHYEANSGWQIGKITEATYAGLVLGYVYYEYGFHLSVMIHWVIDYFGSVFSFFGQAYAGIPWNSDQGYILSNIVAFDLIFLLGISGTAIFSYASLTHLLKKRKQNSF